MGMKHTILASCTGLVAIAVTLVEPGQDGAKPAIRSRILEAENGERTLMQEVLLEASVAEVWKAYTTDAGFAAWAAPVAEVDLRAGGTIRTHYRPDAKIGDVGTNTLHIVNYVPERLLTLRAELQENWPEVMKHDAGNLMNVIVFLPEAEKRTRILSYGCGYGRAAAYEQLLEFFAKANEGLFRKLRAHLEEQARGH